jgi:rhodanese-related sulfurtransferase
MKLVQFKIKPQTLFWFLDNQIRLDRSNQVSDFLNVEDLDEDTIEVVNKSISLNEISAYDADGNPVLNVKNINRISGEHNVDIEDVREPDNFEIPEIVSITVDDDKEEQEDKEDVVVTEELIKEANILLGKNGNTVRKAIRNMPQDNEHRVLLYACYEAEMLGRSRKGIIKDIELAIARYEND